MCFCATHFLMFSDSSLDVEESVSRYVTMCFLMCSDTILALSRVRALGGAGWASDQRCFLRSLIPAVLTCASSLMFSKNTPKVSSERVSSQKAMPDQCLLATVTTMVSASIPTMLLAAALMTACPRCWKMLMASQYSCFESLQVCGC